MKNTLTHLRAFWGSDPADRTRRHGPGTTGANREDKGRNELFRGGSNGGVKGAIGVEGRVSGGSMVGRSRRVRRARVLGLHAEKIDDGEYRTETGGQSGTDGCCA